MPGWIDAASLSFNRFFFTELLLKSSLSLSLPFLYCIFIYLFLLPGRKRMYNMHIDYMCVSEWICIEDNRFLLRPRAYA